MKNLFLYFIASLILIGCSKESRLEQFSTHEKSVKTTQLRVFYDNGGDDYGCTGLGGNCLPDVNVCGNCLDSWIQLILWFVEHQHYPHSIDPQDPNHPSNVYDDLLFLFGKSTAEKLLNGTVSISTKGPNSTDNTLYVIIQNLSGETLAVHPYVLD